MRGGIAHGKPAQRETRSKHGVAGCYTGPESEHYRYYNVFMTETRSEIIAYVVEFFSKM